VIGAIHDERACYEDKDAVGDGARLHVLVIYLVLDSLETEGCDLIGDIFATNEGLATIGHGAVVKVEVDERLTVFHDGGVVLYNEFVSYGIDVHCWRKLFEIII